MPEMPEVETIRRIIEPQIAGRSITSVTVFNEQVVGYPDARTFANLLEGQRVAATSRRGKFLTIKFESGDRMVLHLRMTGQLLVTPPDFSQEKHTHLTMNLSDGNQIRYIDVRRFGRFWYLKSEEEDTVTGQNKLGLEPFDDALDVNYLRAKLSGRRKTIKDALLDQSIVAGIGNIYSDEILYAAGIFPKEKCMDLADSEWEVLVHEIKEVMAWGIKTNTMTPEDYLAGRGKEYANTPVLRIYGREGQQCRKCNSTFERMMVGGRSSCYCPCCQKSHAI